MGIIATRWKEQIVWEEAAQRFVFDYTFDGRNGHLYLPNEDVWKRILPSELHSLFHQVTNEMTAWALSKNDAITQDATGVVYVEAVA